MMDPHVPQRRRTRRWIALPVVLALAAVLTYAEHRSGSDTAYAGLGTPADAKVVQAAAVKLKAACTELNLLSCLEKEPSGATPVLLPWGDSGDVTAQEYAQTYYDTPAADEAIAVQNLQNAGIQAIVHEKWTVSEGQQATADVIVMSFASAQGAQSRALASEGGALSAEASAGLEVAIPGLPGYAYPHRILDADGYVDAEYFATVGNLLMVVHFWSRASFDQTDFGSWALGEYLTLRTARIPAAPVTMISAATTSCSPLAACLVPVPASDPRVTTGWGAISAPTLDQFVQNMYSSVSPAEAVRVTAELENEGLAGTAHAVWQDTAGDGFELDLLRFTTEQGAESRTRDEIGGLDGTEFSVSGPGSAKGSYTTTLDSDNNYDTNVYGYVGDVAVEMHAYSAASKDLSQAASVAQQQFAKLAAVTTVSTVRQPALVVPSTAPRALGGTSSCTDALSCLISVPSGATASDGSTYNDSPEVTVAQFVGAKYSEQPSSYQSYEAGLLTSGGVQKIVHRGWTGVDGDQADVAVLVFANAAQAQSDTMNYQGAVSGSGQLFPVAGYPDAVGSVHTTLDDYGYLHTEIVAYTANFEVRMDYYSRGNFTVSSAQDAIAWFDAQMSMLPRS
jgi:hypothetical protein